MSQETVVNKLEVGDGGVPSSKGTDTTGNVLKPSDSMDVHRRVNKWAARFTPFMLFGAVGYATWVVVALLCVNTYIHPPEGLSQRLGAGIAILVIYSILWSAMVICYGRLLWTMAFNPGLVPLEPANNYIGPFLNRTAVAYGNEVAPTGLDTFISRPRFESDIDGLPRWCNTCKIWKPDRSHHCSQIGRCVYKMDHFCPWAGGVVGETSFKFFIQFCCYAGIYCAFVLIVTAYSFTQLPDRNSFYGRNTAATIGIAVVFGVFSGTLGLQSLGFASRNTTTVDSLGHSTKIYNFAVRCATDAETNNQMARVTFPLDWSARKETRPEDMKTFRVWQTPVGYNPYDLGSALANIRTTMGESVLDWLLPIRHSPSSSFLNAQKDAEAGLPAMYQLRNAVEAIG